MAQLIWNYKITVFFDLGNISTDEQKFILNGSVSPYCFVNYDYAKYITGGQHYFEAAYTKRECDTYKLHELKLIIEIYSEHEINQRMRMEYGEDAKINLIDNPSFRGVRANKIICTQTLHDINDSGVLSLIYHNFRQKQIERPITENKHDNSGVNLEISDNSSV